MFLAGSALAAQGAAMRRSLRTAAASDKETGKDLWDQRRDGRCSPFPADFRPANTSTPTVPGEAGSQFCVSRLELVLKEGLGLFSTPSNLARLPQTGQPRSCPAQPLCFPAGSEIRRESSVAKHSSVVHPSN